jgi:hypothetical protein
MLNERQEGFIDELKETYQRLNEQTKTSGNFNIIDIAPIQDYAEKFLIRKQEIEAENKALLDGYTDSILKELELLNEDLKGTGIITYVHKDIERGMTFSYLSLISEQEYLATKTVRNVFRFTIKTDSKYAEDRNLPEILTKVIVKDQYGISSNCGTLKGTILASRNTETAIKDFIRDKKING